MSKQDKAWNDFFEKTDTIKRINREGFATITAASLKALTGREPRLLAKQDTLNSRPKIFRNHNLAIFPIKNGEYILFQDPEQKTFYQFGADELVLPIKTHRSTTELLAFDSYPRGSNYTESQAIDFAFVSSLLKTFLGEDSMHLVIRGRMRTGALEFTLPNTHHVVGVSGVQVEVDAGYESEDCIYLIEAKVGRRKDFHIRQLFYPYLEWSRRSGKKIRSLFLAYTNSKYFLYEFSFSPVFGELQVVQKQCFTINESPVAEINLKLLYEKIPILPEPYDIPFPQANDLDKVADLISLIEENINSKTEIAESFEFDERQGDYYANAARYLGAIDKAGTEFQLNDVGRAFIQLDASASRTHFIVSQLLQLPTFRAAIQLLEQRGMQVANLTNSEIATIIAEHTLLTGTTPGRRASTVRSWLNWVVRHGRFIE